MELTAVATGFDPLSEAFAADPYPAYAALRAQDGPAYFPAFDTWMLSRYADVTAAALHPKLVRSLDGLIPPEEIAALDLRDNWHDMPNHARFVQFSLLNSDGEVHQRLRKLIFREFTPALINRLLAEVQGFVATLCGEIAEIREIDFIEDFAAKIPGHVIGHLLGVPDEDCPRLRTWSEDIVQYFDIDRTDARKALAERTTTEFYHYLLDLSAARRKSPRDDLMSRLIVEWDAGNLSEDEYISTVMLILMAGHGSTIDVLGSGLHALLRFPDAQGRLRDDPGLMTTAVPEMFRFDAPLPFFHRYATEDIDLNGWHIPRGTKLGLLYASANRDAAQFPHPDRFDVGRTPNRHMAFAGGAHFCLGNHLARLEMETVFSTLLAHFPTIELIDTPVYKRGLSLRGPEALRVRLMPK
jgi:cytochrome P450